MKGALQDLRHGCRMLSKSPGATAVVLLTLALGIGANTAMFSVVNSVLLRPLPYTDPERLVVVWNQYLANDFEELWLSEPEYLDYRERNTVFEDLAIWVTGGANLTGGGAPERVSGAMASPSLFRVLGVDAVLGRTFLESESEPGRGRTILLSHGLWQRRFGGDEGVLSRSLELDGVTRRIVGVMPEGFQFPGDNIEAWIPYEVDPANLRIRGNHFLHSLARLRPGVTIEQAEQEVCLIFAQMLEMHPEFYPDGWRVFLEPLHSEVVGDVRPALLILLSAVGFVLMIACVNVANVQLARSTSRMREIAIRRALGAGQARIIRLLLTESGVLAMAGGAAGVLVAVWGIQAVLAVAPAEVPRLADVAVDARVLGFAAAISLATGLLFGLAPAVHLLRDSSRALRDGARTSASRGHHRMRRMLVVAEVALSLVLLIGAGLMVRSLGRELAVDPGFETTNILTAQLALPEARYSEDHRTTAFYRRLEQRVAALPGVVDAGAVSQLPLSGAILSGGTFIQDAEPNHPYLPFHMIEADWRTTTPGLRRALGIELMRGRWFTEADDAAAPRVVVVDESFARRFWQDADPIGKLVAVDGHPTEPEWWPIVGVVRHVKHNGLSAEGREQIYFAHAQRPAREMFLTLRTSGDPKDIVAPLRREVQSLDAGLPVHNVQEMRQRVAGATAQPRFRTLLLGVFAGLALLLAVAGVYGVMSYFVGERTREIGIRQALGARPGQVLQLVINEGLGLALAGIASGLLGAFALTRVLDRMLYQTSATDPAIFGGVALLMAAFAVLAGIPPARRATRVDPIAALRHE